MNYAMVIVGGLWWLDWTIDENRKNASIFVLFVECRRRLPFDGSVPALLPLWLIVPLFQHSLEVLNVVEGRPSLGLAA
jgi:hypothetical protein